MALDKYALIRSYVKSRLGEPIVSICDGELDAIDNAVASATTDYWVALPYVKLDRLTTSLTCGETFQDIDALKEKLFLNVETRDSAYFIGIVRYELADIHNISPISYNHFDAHLLGRDVGAQVGIHPMQDPRYTSDRILAHTSTEDMVHGELDYRHDIVENQVVFITPVLAGDLQLWYAWGFCPEKTIEILPMIHFNTFKKMVALNFIEIVLAARTALQLNNADFTLNTQDLETKRDALKEELRIELPGMSLHPTVWG